MRSKNKRNIHYDKAHKRYYVRISVRGRPKTARRDDEGNFFTSEGAAKKYLPIFKEKFTSPLVTPGVASNRRVRTTFTQLFEDWFSFISQPWDATSKHQSKGRIMTNIVKPFDPRGKLELSDLTQSHFDKWRLWLANKELCTEQKNRMLNSLGQMCEYSKDFYKFEIPFIKRLLGFTNKSNLHRGKKLEHRRYVSPSDFFAFLSAVDKKKHFGLYTHWMLEYFGGGQRIAESRALHVDSINLETGFIGVEIQVKYINGQLCETTLKTEASEHDTPLPAFVVNCVKEYLLSFHEDPQPSNYMFYSSRNGPSVPMSKSYVDKWRTYYSKIAGVPLFDNHSLRYSYVTNSSRLVKSQVVKTAVGHKNESTTLHYDQSGRLGLEELREKLEEKYSSIFGVNMKEEGQNND